MLYFSGSMAEILQIFDIDEIIFDPEEKGYEYLDTGDEKEYARISGEFFFNSMHYIAFAMIPRDLLEQFLLNSGIRFLSNEDGSMVMDSEQEEDWQQNLMRFGFESEMIGWFEDHENESEYEAAFHIIRLSEYKYVRPPERKKKKNSFTSMDTIDSALMEALKISVSEYALLVQNATDEEVRAIMALFNTGRNPSFGEKRNAVKVLLKYFPGRVIIKERSWQLN